MRPGSDPVGETGNALEALQAALSGQQRPLAGWQFSGDLEKITREQPRG